MRKSSNACAARANRISHPSPPRRYPVAIIGPGALGLVYASRLARVGRVAVIARNTLQAARLRRGSKVGGRIFRAEAFGPEDPPRADWIIVLVKARDTIAAARLAARMAPRGVLSLQNGFIEEALRRSLPGVRAAQGVSTQGAFRSGTTVVPAGAGETILPQGFAPLALQLRRAGLRVRVTGKLAAARLRKVLVNVTINPLTAVLRVRNGELLVPPACVLGQALAREAARVLAAEGLRIEAGAAWPMVAAVARATAKNRSSMLQDVLAGRPTEIEHLNGALLRLARRHRIAVPTHRAIYRLVRLLEPAGERPDGRRVNPAVYGAGRR